MQVPNSKLSPNADGSYPDRKLIAMYDYTAKRFRWAIAQKQSQGVTLYRDIDGEQFSSMDTDMSRYPSDRTPDMTLTSKDLEILLDMAKADAEEAIAIITQLPTELMFEALFGIARDDAKNAIALFSQLPTELKPELQAALKTLPADVFDGLKREAIAHQSASKNHVPDVGNMVDIFAGKLCDRCNRNDLEAEIYCPILDHALTETEPPAQWTYAGDTPTCEEFDAEKVAEYAYAEVAA